MVDWRQLRETVMRKALEVLSDPRLMKLMADPRVMRAVMQALQLRTTAKGAVDRGGRAVARRLRLATKDEISALKARLREMELELESLRAQVEGNGRGAAH